MDSPDASVGKVLVVDDASENLIAIEAALSGLGAELVTATSGETALKRLLDYDFALILLDVHMPDMDGLEAASLIRGRLRSRHIPITFVTAYDQNDDVVLGAYRLGAVDFLFKPINTEVLRAKVSMFVELRHRAEEIARQASKIAEQELADQRRRLEAEALRTRLEEQNKHAEILGQKNEALEQAYAELQRINRRLEITDRRKDEFIAVLGHELRNPLVPIVSGLALLGQTDAQPPERVLSAMTRQVNHLTRLVDDLLDVSRIAEGKLELRKSNVRVAEIIERAVDISSTPSTSRAR